MNNITYKKTVAIIFTFFIFASFVLTFATNPVKIIGGFARGYLNSSEDESLLKKIGNSFNTFDNRMNEYFVFHDGAINSFGFVQKMIGKTLIDDVDKNSEVLKLKNGYLTFKKNNNEDYTELQNYLLSLDIICKKNSVDLVYVNKLSKDTNDWELLPDNFPYKYYSNFDLVKNKLLSNSIEVIDIQSVVDENNINKYSLFFKTDHHWTPGTGLWVSRVIADQLNDKLGYNLNSCLLEKTNFNVELYKDSFLGSQGKRVGKMYVGIDDIEVITPKFETKMELEIKSEENYLKGTFEDVMIHRNSITPDNLLNKDDTAYDTYMAGNHDLVKIHNKTTNSGKSVLLVMDSFGCVVAPYLSLVVDNLDCVDLRSFSYSLEDYIVETVPDVVIYMATNYQKENAS